MLVHYYLKAEVDASNGSSGAVLGGTPHGGCTGPSAQLLDASLGSWRIRYNVPLLDELPRSGLLKDNNVLPAPRTSWQVLQHVEVLRVMVEDVFLRMERTLVLVREYTFHLVRNDKLESGSLDFGGVFGGKNPPGSGAVQRYQHYAFGLGHPLEFL